MGLKAIVQMGLVAVGVVAFAEPSVEITDVKFTNAANGVATHDKDNTQLLAADYIDSTGVLVATHDAAIGGASDAKSGLMVNVGTGATVVDGANGTGTGEVLVTAITAQQRQPWYPGNGLVDIEVTLVGASNDVAMASCAFFATNGVTLTMLPITHVTREGSDIGSDNNWTRHFVWDAAADLGGAKFDDIAISARAELGVQLWENGPYWAECNVGATKPEEYGYYFWWGDTVGYKRMGGNFFGRNYTYGYSSGDVVGGNYNEVTWVSSEGASMGSSPFNSSICPTANKNIAQLQSEGFIDSAGNLNAAHDAATVHLGFPWRMPTDAEFSELIGKCETVWTKQNGVYGRLVKGKGNFASKSIFFPAAGCGNVDCLDFVGSDGYGWTSTPHFDHLGTAWCIGFGIGRFLRSDVGRCCGVSVRPLRERAETSMDAVTTHLALDCRIGLLVDRVTLTAVTATSRNPQDGKVDINVTFRGGADDVAKVECSFAATNIATLTEMSVAHVARHGEDVGSGTIWTRHYVWDAAVDVGPLKSDDIVLVAMAKVPLLGGVQLWEGGPYWAECNVGTTKPEESGYYFWWGDTVGYTSSSEPWNDNGVIKNISWVSSMGERMGSSPFDSSRCPTYGKDRAVLISEGHIDVTGNLVSTYDAATVHLGAPWRMPTEVECSKLLDQCKCSRTTQNGVYGCLITGKGTYASKNIFLPSTGYSSDSCLYYPSEGDYWSSTSLSGSSGTWYLAFGPMSGSSGLHMGSTPRYCGLSVRPVRDFDSTSTSVVTTSFTLDSRRVILSSVTARQRDSGSRLVDIEVTLLGTSNDVAKVNCIFTATNNATSGALPITSVTREGSDVGAGNTWMRHLVWDAAADLGAIKFDDIELVARVEEGVQLWKNGPYWAEYNIGAIKPEECGYYFWWGDAIGYKLVDDHWEAVDGSNTSFAFNGENCPTFKKSRDGLLFGNYLNSEENLAIECDAASAHLGVPWRMPTDAEFEALINNCDTVWTMQNGVPGRLVTGKGAYSTRSIFFPATGIGDGENFYEGPYGYYWSSSPYWGNDDYAWGLHVKGGVCARQYQFLRCYGLPVRPIRDSSSTTSTDVVATHFPLDCRVEVQAGDVAVTAVTARQRYPWNGLVDIIVTLTGASNDVAAAECVFATTNCATMTELPITRVVRNGGDSGSGSTWVRHFVWDAAADVGTEKIDDVVISVMAKTPLGGVQLWEGGPYWAECNVGATKPEEYGYYFWWGDTVGYRRDGSSWNAVDGSRTGFYFGEGNCPTFSKLDEVLQAEGYIDSIGNLAAEHDAATVYLGDPWRMPTHAELGDIIEKCDTMWATRDGVGGWLVKGKGDFASKSIFLPAASIGVESGFGYGRIGSTGYYWSSTSSSDGACHAWYLYFESASYQLSNTYCRYHGNSVRPVRKFVDTSSDAVTTHLALDCRTGERVVGATEMLTFSSRWDGDDDSTVTIRQNGTAIFEGLSGDGSTAWSVKRNGRYELTHTTYKNGVAGQVEFAVFVVEGIASEYEVLDGAFADVGEVASDGNGGWKVTLTNDVAEVIEIGDNLGAVTIDLNGRDLIGKSGADGDETTPGGDGAPAICIVATGEDGAATQLTVVNSGETGGIVAGGAGGTGNPPGNGGAAIEVVSDAKSGTVVSVGAGVTVVGGAGGADVTGTGTGGEGGAGLVGDVDTNDGVISGGAGGASENGTPGARGIAVTGEIGNGSGAITKVEIPVPVVAAKVYTGAMQKADVADSERYTVAGNDGWTDVGERTIYFVLTDSVRYCWTDVSGDTATAVFMIMPKQLVDAMVGAVAEAMYTGAAITPKPTVTDDGTVLVEGTDYTLGYENNISIGPASVIVTGQGNYCGMATQFFRIVSTEAEALLEKLGDVGAVTPDDNGGWKVTLTNDVAEVIEIGDNLGPVTIDLNGRDLIGKDGADGDVAAVGGDGHPAIHIVATGEEGEPTRLTLVNSSEAGGTVAGGAGGAGNPPGKGAPGVCVDFACVAGARVDIGESVAVRDGEGGADLSDDGDSGDGDGDDGKRYSWVAFDVGAGVCDECDEGIEVEWGGSFGKMPKPARQGYTFGGWYGSPDYATDTLVCAGVAAPGGDLTLYAKWDRRRLWYTEYTFNLAGAETYQGYLLDANEIVAGTIELKVGKPNKGGVSKVTATIQIAGAKKEKLKGTTFDGTFAGTTKNGRKLDLRIGANGCRGTFANYEIDAARNVFRSKDADAKIVAAQALRCWQGAYVLSIGTENGYAGISLEVRNKGAVKVAGVLPDGNRLSGKAQLLVGERECAIAFSYTKKESSIAFLVWLCEDGSVECSNLTDPNWKVKVAVAKAGPYLNAGARFHVDGAAMVAKTRLPLQVGLLPEGVAVNMANNRFTVAKAGKVKLLKDKSGIDPAKLGGNPSGLKLSYTLRNCSFKGSFTVYAIIDGKLKKYKASVTGVVLESVGYGMATIKGLGSFPVTIE